jgi:hypothetical protein
MITVFKFLRNKERLEFKMQPNSQSNMNVKYFLPMLDSDMRLSTRKSATAGRKS